MLQTRPVCILGAGSRGRDYLDSLRVLGRLDRATVIDRDAAALESVRREYGVRSSEQLEPGCEAGLIVFALPPAERQAAAIERVLESCAAPNAAIVEKPFALGVAEAERVVGLFSRFRIPLTVSHQLRWAPEFRSLKAAVDSGELGRIIRIEASCFGNLLDQGSHLVDLLGWLLAEPVEWVTASGENELRTLARSRPIGPELGEDRHHPAPYFVDATLGWPGGTTAQLSCGLCAPITRPELGAWLQKRVRVVGSNGIAEAHCAGHFRRWSRDGALLEDHASTLQSYRQATTDMLDAVLRADGENGAIPSRSLLRSAKVMEALYASLAQGGARIGLNNFTAQDWIGQWRLRSHPRARMPAAAGVPMISVILPMDDHRGYGLRSLARWTQRQSAPAESFEVIVVINARTRRLRKGVEALLRAQDRLLVSEDFPRDHAEHDVGEIGDYELAVRKSRAPWLFLTEPHCFARSDAIARIQEYIADTDYDGFCCASNPVNPNAIAAAESKLYEEGFKTWQKPGDWRKVILRGFALTRRAYDEVGGFQVRYDRFAEWLLAADLKRGGYRMGYAKEVVVGHANSTTFALLDQFIRTFTNGECRYRLEHAVPDDDPYFPAAPEWTEFFCQHRAAALGCLLALLRVLLRHPQRRFLWRELPAALAAAALGPQRIVWRYFLRVNGAKLRTQWARLFDRAAMAAEFARYYELETSYARVRYLARHATPGDGDPLEAESRITLAANGLGRLYNAHSPEAAGEHRFRWLAPCAAVRVAVPEGATRLKIHFAPFDPQAQQGVNLFAAIGFRRLKPKPAARFPGEATFRLPRDLARNGPLWVCLITSRFPAPGDARDLGMPVGTLEFV